MRLFFIFAALLFSSFSYSADSGWSINGVYYSSPDSACSAVYPSESCRFGTGGYTFRVNAAHAVFAYSGAATCWADTQSCNSVGVVFGDSVSVKFGVTYFSCVSPKVSSGSGLSQSCLCPSGQGETDSGGCEVCPSGQVVNPNTNKCQLPCPVESDHVPSHISGVSDPAWVGTSIGYMCESGCKVLYTSWSNIDDQGFDVTEITNFKNGEFCSTGSINQPPTKPARNCLPPNVVRSDGTCGPPDPTCDNAWEHIVDHQCVDKDCSAGKVMKCGTVSGSRFCACTGPQDCDPGQHKDVYGNCITDKSCTPPQVQDPVTGACKAQNEVQCPANHHREGILCVPDPSTPPAQNPATNPDIDHDGIPNNQDSDADGDGTPNSSDADADNDGIPNSSDLSPNGPGTTRESGISGFDPNADPDKDGIPNSTDSDRDGDGIPNWNDATPDGNPNKPSGTGGDGTGGDGDGDGDGDGEGDEEEDKDKPGSPYVYQCDLYEPLDYTLNDVFVEYLNKVQTSGVVYAINHFFSIGNVSASCPHWVISIPYLNKDYIVDFQCSDVATSAFNLIGTIVLVLFAWAAFEIAFI